VLLFGLSLTRCDFLSHHDRDDVASVGVMSQNLYLGGPIFRLVEDPTCAPTEANPTAPAICADEIYAQVVASDFAARAEAIADEIEHLRPALVGLQEVSTYTVNAEVTIDFLAILLDALADRGLTYSAVSENVNLALELPATPDGGQTFYNVAYQDADVVLALDSPDVSTGATEEVTFAALFEFTVGPITQDLGRGYQTVEATVDGFAFTFVNTHLEIAEIAPVRDAQGAELAAAVEAIEGPVVLVGDLNSTPDEAETAPYPVLTESLADVYDRPRFRAQPTCCQAPDLENETSALEKRIDFVLYRGIDRVVGARTVLDEPDDRVESGGRQLWPSDHAGVAALLTHDLD
jgi:endonuclease/exonuclease/phosphatase family metal-dependent hydrolase